MTIAPTGTDSETTGDLNVTNSMTIVGASAASTIIDANTIDRVLSIDAGATVTISNVTIRNGLVSDLGGGILNRGTLTLNDSVVAGNFTLGGSAGAGILNFQTLTLNRTSVRDNQASGGNGGGLFNGTSATMVLNSSTVSGNQTLNGSYGGGIVNDGTATLNGSLIANNRAAGKGGGIWNASGTLTLTNSTISNNSAFSDGGGVYNNATFSTYFATIAGNLADDTATGAAFGGGLFNASGAVSLKGTILSQNYSGASSVSDDCSGKIGALDYNLIESVPNGCFVQLLGSGNVTAVPSRLHSLRDNGGQTQTRALSAGSPAVDAVPLGNCTDPLGAPLTIDQRGIPRPVGGLCDMGAFEGSLATGLIGVNLIRNGDAEGSAGSPTGAGVGMPYWSGSAAIVPYGAPGGFPLVTDPGPANRGRNFFSGGVSAVAQISQVIDIEAIGAAVDAGQIRYDLSGYFGGFANQNDRADIVAFFYTTSDGSGVSFAHSGTIGDVLAADRGNQTGLLFRSTSGVVPGGARSIRVSLSIVNGGAAGTYNDGYADSLSLVLSPRIARPRDFNGDGTSDVLWRHGTGVVYTWFMNKTTVVAAGSPGSVGTDWTIAGVGDFNGDGKADILWRHTSGAVYIWLMDGTTVIGTGSPGAVGTDWTIAAVGDFNGDGNADILWRHSSGAVYIWLMNGTTVIGTGSPGAVGTDWTIAGVGDFNGDGKADILWRHSSGAVYIWLMDGTSIAGTGSPGSVSSDWTIQGVGD
ncbi:MAG TPA: FG-GAP-like repeat-containing protein, partial [Candidatus Methylomirabilis sp.]|nr:FG-GAP-like repeat-containing protein [Candidatus Methylomirabilis sp.]